MKKLIGTAAAVLLLISCNSRKQQNTEDQIVTKLDLVNVENDKVKVSVDPAKFTSENTTFYIPKTVPGTYENNDYGQFIENLKALDYQGNELSVEKANENSWKISNAEQLDKVTYEVNDSYDVEGENGVFSPAGSNIEKGENFTLNLHSFVGYFEGLKEKQHKIEILRPKDMVAGTSLNPVVDTTNADYTVDEFTVPRYFAVTDHPIMYNAPDTASFNLQGMKVKLSVYSPNGIHNAQEIKPKLEEMMEAQKSFLGEIDDTKVYFVLLYLSDTEKTDASGFGALEHHTSTTVVLPETMNTERLNETMKDVVSHEFFHILTPLSIHSNEIHYFDYNDPKMSEHLWMYEGTTEYFANLFQVDQELIDHRGFYDRMAEKIASSQNYDDTMPFTEMSKNVLQKEYHKEYLNVYQKGALIGMSLDIRLRELSGGKMGLLDLMKKLSDKYGKNKPFEDNELFPAIVELSYPEIGDFLRTYVSGNSSIPYGKFLNKVGVEKTEKESSVYYLLKDRQTPYIDVDQAKGEIFFREGIELNTALQDLGVKQGDVLVSVNGTGYNLENVRILVQNSISWKAGDKVKMSVKRDGGEKELSGTWTAPKAMSMSLEEMELPAGSNKLKLRKAWLGDGA
jgi:predicted metalloprotease with PDZ domain